MRLIDADAEITKIEKEIEKYEIRIVYLENKKEEEPNNNYNDWDKKIDQCKRNILDCKKEIRVLRSYRTAYDAAKVAEQLESNSYMTDSTYDEEGFSNDDAVEVVNLSNAIRIVEGGGVK